MTEHTQAAEVNCRFLTEQFLSLMGFQEISSGVTNQNFPCEKEKKGGGFGAQSTLDHQLNAGHCKEQKILFNKQSTTLDMWS